MCFGEEMRGHNAGQIRHDAHHRGMLHGTCGCSCGGRRFPSKKERKEMLEEYKETLTSELEGVEEELRALKGE